MRKHFNLFSQYLIGVLFGLGLMTSGKNHQFFEYHWVMGSLALVCDGRGGISCDRWFLYSI